MGAARLAVVSNQKSTRNAGSLDRVRTALSGYSGPLLHREIEDVGNIPEILAAFAAFQPDILVINGGDGTVQAVLTEAARSEPFTALPPVLLLPGGQTNLIAEDLGGVATPEAIVERFLPVFEAGRWQGHLTERPLIRMKLTPQDTPIYGAFFGTAAIIRGVDFVRRRIHPLGWPKWLTHTAAVAIFLTAGMVSGRSRNSPFRADMARVTTEDGIDVHDRHFLIMATTLNRLILGLRPFPSGDGPGLKLVSVRYSAITLFKGMAAALMGRLDGRAPKGVLAEQTARAWIQIDCPVTLDGEIFTPLPDVPIELSVTRPVTFLRIGER